MTRQHSTADPIAGEDGLVGNERFTFAQAVETLRALPNHAYAGQRPLARGFPAGMRRADWHAEFVTTVAVLGIAGVPEWASASAIRAGLARRSDGRWRLTAAGRALVVEIATTRRGGRVVSR